MLKKTALLLLVAVMATGACQAQMKTSGDVVKAVPVPAEVSGVSGQRVEFSINLDITKKWHIYAHGDSNFIGVDLVPAEAFPLEDLKVDYPAGHEGEFFGEKVFMIAGKDVIKASALVPEDMKAGSYDLDLAVTAQACDDKTCLAPADIPVAVKLTIK